MPRGERPVIFCALDTDDLNQALALARALSGLGIGFKFGKQFFTAHGPAGVAEVMAAVAPAPMFLDLKFHDIPNTVAGAIRSACKLKPKVLNVHATGGPAMLRAAKQAALAAGGEDPAEVLAVTILTSLDDADLAAVGLRGPAGDRAVALARLAQDCGLDGVVCAATEISAIQAACGPVFKLLSPGIRPAGSAVGDQKRVMTPAEAVAAGADYLVIGRPINAAADPAEAARDILAELN